jgi:hypothetical protein
MKHLLILIFLSSLGWNAIAQENASTEALKLLNNKNISADSLDKLTERMLGSGNPYAVIYLENDSTNINVQRAKMMIDGIAYSNENIASILTNWSQWESSLKKIKKPKLKAAAIDSLYQLNVSTFDEYVAKGRALQGIQRFLKKNQLQDFYQSKQTSLQDSFERFVWINESIAAAGKTKNKKWSIELATLRSQEDANYVANRDAFISDLVKAITSQAQSTPLAPEKPIEKPNNQIWWTVIIGLAVLFIALLVLYFASLYKWKKKTHLLEEKVVGSQNELTEQIQSLQLLHGQSASTLQMLKSEIHQRDIQLGQLKKDHTLKEQKVSEELSLLQNETRQLLDELSKEASVQKWMELQNVLSRKINQIKELL